MSDLKATGSAGRPEAVERADRSEAERPAPGASVAAEVERLRLELAKNGIPVPSDLSELDEDETNYVLDAMFGMSGFSARAKHVFYNQVREGSRRRAETAGSGKSFRSEASPHKADVRERETSGSVPEVSRVTTVRDAGVPDAHRAMVEMMGTVLGFARELDPYLDLEGRLTPEDMPYGKWLRLESVAALIWGTGDERILGLERDVAALRSAAAGPAAAGSAPDGTLAALEAEVAAMVESGKAPEAYSERADRKEKPHEFLKRVYGRYLEKGREVLYLFHLRKVDAKLAQALADACSRSGVAVSQFIPTRAEKVDRILSGSAPGSPEEIAKAILARRVRDSRTRNQQ